MHRGLGRLRLLPLLLSVLLLLVPAATATQPQAPLEGILRLEGTPTVGQAVTLEATATAVLHEGPLSVVVPDWVHVEGPASWTPREGQTERWLLTPQREGAWKASLGGRDDEWSYGICCIYAYDLGGVAGSNAHSERPPPPWPAEADVRLTQKATQDGFRITYRVTPLHDWMRDGTLHVRVQHQQEERTDEGNDTVGASWDITPVHGQPVYLHVASGWNGRWEGRLHNETSGTTLDCRNLQLEQREERLVIVGEHSCYARPATSGVPSPSPLLLAPLAALLRRR